MKTKYLAIIASAAICASFAPTLLRADDQKDKLEKAKRLEEKIRQAEPPVESTTTKKSQGGEDAGVYRPKQKSPIIKEPPSPVVTTSTTTAKALPATTVSSSTTTAKAPPTTTVSSSTTTTTASGTDKPKKTEPDKSKK